MPEEVLTCLDKMYPHDPTCNPTISHIHGGGGYQHWDETAENKTIPEYPRDFQRIHQNISEYIRIPWNLPHSSVTLRSGNRLFDRIWRSQQRTAITGYQLAFEATAWHLEHHHGSISCLMFPCSHDGTAKSRSVSGCRSQAFFAWHSNPASLFSSFVVVP